MGVKNDSRYEQCEISPETIKTELRDRLRQTDKFKKNYNTDKRQHIPNARHENVVDSAKFHVDLKTEV